MLKAAERSSMQFNTFHASTSLGEAAQRTNRAPCSFNGFVAFFSCNLLEGEWIGLEVLCNVGVCPRCVIGARNCAID